MTAHLPLLLRLVASNGSALPLLERGLRYSQIASLLTTGENLGLLSVDPTTGAVSLTDAGRSVLRLDTETGCARGDGGFIMTRNSAKVDKLSTDAVYLPPKRKSFFGLDRPASPLTRERRDGDSPS